MLLWIFFLRRCAKCGRKTEKEETGGEVESKASKRREESVEATSLPKYQVGNTALLEANTKGRGCNLFYISSFCIHSQMYATLLVRFS